MLHSTMIAFHVCCVNSRCDQPGRLN